MSLRFSEQVTSCTSHKAAGQVHALAHTQDESHDHAFRHKCLDWSEHVLDMKSQVISCRDDGCTTFLSYPKEPELCGGLTCTCVGTGLTLRRTGSVYHRRNETLSFPSGRTTEENEWVRESSLHSQIARYFISKLKPNVCPSPHHAHLKEEVFFSWRKWGL